jgi:DNA-binding CsgD family transcriptional regulator
VATQTLHYKTGDAAFTVNQFGVITSWNKAAEKEFGFTSVEALGSRCWQLLAGLDSHGNRYCCENCPLIAMALRNESVHSTEVEFLTAFEGHKKFKLSSLIVYGNPENGLLMHICHEPDEFPDHVENNHTNHRPSADYQHTKLTTREQEVLELLSEGNTTREIASIMCVSEATVRNHIQHTLDKLHVHSRLEAVVLGQRLDII